MKWRSGTLDDLYFEWLYFQISNFDQYTHDHYWNLARALYRSEFKCYVLNDDNRIMDGLELRTLFLDEEELDNDPYWETLPCSIFEMLVALARRLEYEGGRSVAENFWMFIWNMHLHDWDDHHPKRELNLRVKEQVRILNRRLYSYDGSDGGLFPLHHPLEDQRHIEIWYQMAAYLREEV